MPGFHARTILPAVLCVALGAASCLRLECSPLDTTCSPGALLLSVALLNTCETTEFVTYAGGAGSNPIAYVIQTANFDYVAVGSASEGFGEPLNAHTGGGVNDIWISRYGQSGELLWSTFYGSALQDDGQHVLELADGSLIVTGDANAGFGTPLNPHQGNTDMAILRLSADGALIWNTFAGSPALDRGEAAVLRPDGLFWVAGRAGADFTGSAGTPFAAYTGSASMAAAVLFDDAGTPSFNALLGPAGDTAAFTSAALFENSAVFGGFAAADFGSPVNPHSGGFNDTYVQALTNTPTPALGNSTFFGGTTAEIHDDSTRLPSNELVTVGGSLGTAGAPIRGFSGGFDMALEKFSSSGDRIFNTYLGGAGNDTPEGSSALSDGSSVVTGRSTASWGAPLRAFQGSTAEVTIARLQATGELISSTFYGDGGNSGGNTVTGTCDGGLLVSGESSGEFTGLDPALSPHTNLAEDSFLLKLPPGEL